MRIGFFDSGIGGLTVLHEAIKLYPHAHYIYYADTDNVPYGTKSKKEITRLTFKAVDFLVEKNIDLLVIACNTATSVAIKKVRKKYALPVIGMEPAIKPATQLKSKQKRILVSATKRTLKEKKLLDLIADLDVTDKIDLLSLQKLVSYAEDFKMESKAVKAYLERKLSKIEWPKYNSLVLGCTHFIYFRELIRKSIPSHVKIIDGNSGTVRRMLELLPAGTKKKKIQMTFYRSGKKMKARHFEKFLDFCKQSN